MRNESEYANNLFEQPWWMDIVAPDKWKEIVAKNEDDEIIARLPVVVEGSSVCMPELTQTLGIWMPESFEKDYGAQKKAMQQILEQLKRYKNIRIALAPDNKYILPFRWAGFVFEPRFTYRINDLSDMDGLYKGFNKTAKKNIKAAKNKVTITDTTDTDELWTMLCKTFEAQNRKNPMSKDLVYRIVEKCDATGNGKYLSAKDDAGNVHSCAYFVYDDNVCYYLLGATDSEYRSSGAQSLIIWEGIQFAALHSKIFDFEGSMVEGIENFFRQFNAECVAYYEVRKQSMIKEIMLLAKPGIKKLLGYKN